MEAEIIEQDVLLQAGDFNVYLCCYGAHEMWVERISTGEAADLPKADTHAALQLPAERRGEALERIWRAHA